MRNKLDRVARMVTRGVLAILFIKKYNRAQLLDHYSNEYRIIVSMV